jgi:hypothetical protein
MCALFVNGGHYPLTQDIPRYSKRIRYYGWYVLVYRVFTRGLGFLFLIVDLHCQLARYQHPHVTFRL